ncbi:MAG: hypothetical protein K6G91_07220, partial [Kiritimatiellae bacterium]|nr:hypothetical protein [Kiritimatiellia bacterium]
MIRKLSLFGFAVSFAFASYADLAPVTYVDSNGVSQVCNSYTVVDENNMEWTTGWYVVDGTLDLNEFGSGVVVSGDVHLILTDGSSMTVQGCDFDAGVRVEVGDSLAIYGQTAGTGRLVATGGGYGGPGIGSREQSTGGAGCGTVIINGGVVTAVSSDGGGAGIGGGWNTDGGVVVVNGGVVKAVGSESGAGIGGGCDWPDDVRDIDSGTVVVNGGEVEAIGGLDGSGIGGGNHGAGAVVVIDGGTVKATGGERAAGIGGGYEGSGGSFTIKNGVADIKGGVGGAGIGGGAECPYDVHGVGLVSIEGGVVYVLGGDNSAGIGLGGRNATLRDFTYGAFVAQRMVVYTGNSRQEAVVANLGAETNMQFTALGAPLFFSAKSRSSYVDRDGVLRDCHDYAAVASNTVVWTNGWYIVGDSDLCMSSGVRVSGNVNLIVSDGCSLSVTGDTTNAGISIAQGGSLSVFGQIDGTGTIVAVGGSGGGAGIGGDAGQSGETVAVYGGTVFAIGGMSGAAGIGAGVGGATQGTLVVASGKTVKSGVDETSLLPLSVNAGGVVSLDGNRVFKIGYQVSYLDAQGIEQRVAVFTQVEAGNVEWRSGWYVVDGDVDLGVGGVTVSGDVNLILCDGASLTVQGEDYGNDMLECGISVPYGNSLTIYGQANGTGSLS